MVISRVFLTLLVFFCFLQSLQTLKAESIKHSATLFVDKKFYPPSNLFPAGRCSASGWMSFSDMPRATEYTFVINYRSGQKSKQVHKKLKKGKNKNPEWSPVFGKPSSVSSWVAEPGFLYRNVFTPFDSVNANVRCDESMQDLLNEFRSVVTNIEITTKFKSLPQPGIEGVVQLGSACYKVANAFVIGKAKGLSVKKKTDGKGRFFLPIKKEKFGGKDKLSVKLSVQFNQKSYLLGTGSSGDTSAALLFQQAQAETKANPIRKKAKKSKSVFETIRLAGCGS